MDERTLFDQFHEALDVEPRPGAYERMRFAMTNHPVALKGLPAFRMRWSKMGLRVVAVLAAAVIAIAVGAAILAAHHGPLGSIPAGQDPKVKPYQALILSDYNTMAASTSTHCTTIQDSGCAAAIKAVIPTLQKWVADLQSAQTPTQFVFIDSQMRGHLNQAVTDLNAAVAYQKANNKTGFAMAMNAGFYERAWIDPATFAIEGSYPRVAGSYHDALSLARQSLNGCVSTQPGPADLACTRLAQQCTGITDQTCEDAAQASATQLETFLIGFLQNPAPSALTTKDHQLQADLAKADTELLAVTGALLSGDTVKAGSAESLYMQAIVAAYGDTNVIGVA